MNKNKKMPLIGISGKAGVGKDLVGVIIQYLVYTEGIINMEYWEKFKSNSPFNQIVFSKYVIKKFADKLKTLVCLLIGCTRQQLEDRNFKEKELGEEWDVKIITYIDGELHKIYNPSDSEDFDIKCKYPRSYISNIIKQTPRSLLQKIGTDLFRNQLHPNTWVNASFANYLNNAWIFTDVRFPNELEAIKKRKGVTIRVNRGLVERTGKMIQEPEHISETALDDAKFDYVIENNGTIEELLEQVKKILIKEEII